MSKQTFYRTPSKKSLHSLVKYLFVVSKTITLPIKILAVALHFVAASLSLPHLEFYEYGFSPLNTSIGKATMV